MGSEFAEPRLMITIGLACVITILTILLSTAGLLYVRRKISFQTLKLSHDVADPLLSVVGTLFAVLLGFMVANSMQRFEEARVTTQQEASAVANIFRAADGFSSPTSDEIKNACHAYVDMVINDEWPKLGVKQASEEAWVAYDRIWNACIHYQPGGNADSNIQQGLMGYLGTLGDSRRMRIGALHNGLPPPLWIVLLLGGCATICFTYFFGIEKLKLQIVMTSLVSLAICLNLFLLASFDDPFSGDVMVHPTAFTNVLHDMDRMLAKKSSGIK
jgi:hypothetical protein